jgi:serine/threonine-protein kinase
MNSRQKKIGERNYLLDYRSPGVHTGESDQHPQGTRPMHTETSKWVGRTLANGRYQVTSKLGEGGMGCVFKARDRKLDSDVVIKIPHPHLLHGATGVARFEREIRALVKLEHPHIVRVIDVDKQDGLPFIVMQYLAGGSLEDRRPPRP